MSDLTPISYPYLHPGKGVNVEGAVPSEQEVNQPKPAKRARTSFTADQLQVGAHLHLPPNTEDCEEFCNRKHRGLWGLLGL